MDEAGMVEKILDRDAHALHGFYRTYAPKLTRYIQGKIRDTHDAEEVFQDTMFAFLESIRDFHGTCKISTFLFSIANHKVVDFYRRKKLRQCVFSQMPQLEELISPVLNPEEALDATVLKEKLRAVFAGLLPNYRIVLELKYMEDCSVVEIARQCSWTTKKAESLLFRARKAFMKAFVSYERSVL